jgi:hypothetical protein
MEMETAISGNGGVAMEVNRVLLLSETKVLLTPHMKTYDKPTYSEIRHVWTFWG